MDSAEIAGFREDLLGRDIRQFGTLPGAAIRAKQGNEVFDRIASICPISVQFRRGQAEGAQKTLRSALQSLSLEESAHSIPLFSYFSLLANIADDQHHSRRARAHLVAGPAPDHGGLAHMVETLSTALTLDEALTTVAK
jgi:phosphoenolpyruvate carboxylase